jgi:hypothetical protein
MNNAITWKRGGYGEWISSDGKYTIRKTSNPTAARVWYVLGGSREFMLALCVGGATPDGGFFALGSAKIAVSSAASLEERRVKG